MSKGFLLQGPLPFSLRDPGSSGKAAAALAARWMAVPNAGTELAGLATGGGEPGLYLLWTDEPQPAIAGFWLAFGPEYTLDGPVGPPDREVPFARDLLNALTEAVWWQSLRVTPLEKGGWTPTLVLEWLPAIANRSALSPPGRRVKRAVVRDELSDPLEGGGWLLPTAAQMAAVQTEDVEAFAAEEEPSARLPSARSLIAVVQGELRRGMTSHAGSFVLLDPAQLDGEQQNHRIPLGDWLARAAKAGAPSASAERAELGAPLELPGDRVGFPFHGWLTSGLAVWPPVVAQIRPGTLQPRDIGVRWLRQSWLAIAIIATVAIIGVSVALATSAFTKPVFKPSPPAREQAPQPALSLCSAEHEAFVSELRCQIEEVVNTAGVPRDVDEPVCRDARSVATSESLATLDLDLRSRNMQPKWCGLHDRELDDSTPNGYDAEWTQLVAARACFNVLGHPYTYTMARTVDEGSPHWPDPRPLLEPGNLQVKPLSDLVTELNATCDSQRANLERNIEGAILATHIGAPPRNRDQEAASYDDPQRLQAALTQIAIDGMRHDEAECFEAGRREGVSGANRYAGLCDPEPASLFTPVSRSDAWRELGGESQGRLDEPVIGSYVSARFPDPSGVGPKLPSLWRCHLRLEGALPAPTRTSVPTRWGLTAPLPRSYRTPGKVSAQAVLDAALLQIEEGDGHDDCWTVIADRLNRYQPVHPLLEPLAEEAWPSTEQQLCGQMCAARYRGGRAAGAGPWVTPGSDLEMCMRRESPEGPDGGLDRLRIPWNANAAGDWVTPTTEDICAFNLVAQSRFAAGDAVLPVADAVPFEWAGESALGSAIAGGPSGLASRAARNLRSYGQARSVESCGHVATVCFGSGLLEVVGAKGSERQDWSRQWSEWLSQLVRARPRDLAQTSPWCALVHPYLPRAGRLPEGQLDYPCAKGVDDARSQIEVTLSALANGDGDAGASR